MGLNQNIELNIEELILHGFSPSDRLKIGEAIRTELARIVSQQGLPAGIANGGDITNIDGVSFRMTKNTNAQLIGTRIAQSVYGGLKNER